MVTSDLTQDIPKSSQSDSPCWPDGTPRTLDSPPRCKVILGSLIRGSDYNFFGIVFCLDMTEKKHIWSQSYPAFWKGVKSLILNHYFSFNVKGWLFEESLEVSIRGQPRNCVLWRSDEQVIPPQSEKSWLIGIPSDPTLTLIVQPVTAFLTNFELDAGAVLLSDPSARNCRRWDSWGKYASLVIVQSGPVGVW